MDKKSVFFVLICLIIGIVTSGCLDNGDTDATIMSFKELADDYNVDSNNDTKEVIQQFQSLEEGDILLIQDTIINISFVQSDNYTWIEFSSSPGEIFYIAGNITDDYGPGDTIEIRMHIGSQVFTEENPSTGEMWTYDMEVMVEGWDNESHEYIPVPQEYIKHINPVAKKVSMTFREFVTDLAYDYDNDTKTMTYWFRTLNDGDTVIIHDTIYNVAFIQSEDLSNIEFSSFKGNNFSIAGDITDDYSPGDTVEIKMHIISVLFTDRDTYTNELWTINMETMKEGWNTENNEYIPVPQKYLTHAERDNGDAVIMTFYEFINDYRSNIDNDSRIITYYFQSLDKGDTLIIQDTINTISYNATRGYTSIEFISYPGDTFPIEGDITDEFRGGDTVEITVHIIDVSFNEDHPTTGETWTFNIETFEEEWDSVNKTYKLLPAEYIQHA